MSVKSVITTSLLLLASLGLLLLGPKVVFAEQTSSSALSLQSKASDTQSESSSSSSESTKVAAQSSSDASSQATSASKVIPKAKAARTQLFAEQDVTPEATPSSDPIIFLGLWLTSGFNLQPTEEGYIPIHYTSSLTANGHRSWLAWLLNIFAGPKYTWYSSHDGQHWDKVGSNDKKLSITENQTGTVYYQLNIKWSTFLNPFSTSIWSRVSTIHWVPEPKSATGLTVKADYPYLMNDISDDPDSTFVHALPTPKDATPANIAWSSDNPDIATVDAQTGEVTAVNKAEGIATIRCTWTNYDHSQLTGTTTIEVGGGLHDQTVEEGQPATFKILGNTNSNGQATGMTFDIVWHQRDQNDRDKIVARGSDMTSYTTPATTMADTNNHFYAVITVTAQGKSKTVTTNKAKLTVIPGVHLALKNTLYNETAPDQHNAENTVLTDVQPGDQLRYQDVIKNQATGGHAQEAVYTTYLHAGDEVEAVKVGDQTLSKDAFTLKNDGNQQVLTIPNIRVDAGQAQTITIESKVGEQEQGATSFEFQPSLRADNREFKGQVATINYASADLIRILPANIDYGRQANLVSGILYQRTASTNAPKPVLAVSDSRHQRTPLAITLTQDGDFVNQDQTKIPALRFRYYQGRHFIPVTPHRLITVEETGQDEELHSIVWQPNQGLMLTANQHNLPAGDFHTSLTWTVKSGY